MARRGFTDRERAYLLGLDAVEEVSEGSRIAYSPGFRASAVERWAAGEDPSEIFASAGMPASLVGARRISKAFERWPSTADRVARAHARPGNIDRTEETLARLLIELIREPCSRMSLEERCKVARRIQGEMGAWFHLSAALEALGISEYEWRRYQEAGARDAGGGESPDGDA